MSFVRVHVVLLANQLVSDLDRIGAKAQLLENLSEPSAHKLTIWDLS